MSENMIPFAGAGRYRLANGQTVNLSPSGRCQRSDKIQSSTGLCLDWVWEGDGSIRGLGPVSDQLYLVKKLPDVKYYNNPAGWLDNTAYIVREEKAWRAMSKSGVLSDAMEWDSCRDKTVADRRWIEITEGDALKLLDANASKPVEPNTKVKGDFMFIKKEEVTMEKATAIKVATGVAKFAGKWGWRTVNYWGFQPITEVATRIMRAVRYVTLTGAIVGGVYAYNNPEKAMDLFKSCLPKITIESPEILKS